MTAILTDEQRTSFDDHGFVKIEAFADRTTCDGMLTRVNEVVHQADRGDDIGRALIMMETQADFDGRSIEYRVSKVFRLTHDPVFREFATRSDVVSVVRSVLGIERVSTFLSQFIFKNAGAWGQPWHQDSFYFPFEPARPIVGVWLAVTEATLDNGCLHVLPGSHTERVHRHVTDRRPDAQFGYVEIVDHDMAASTPVLMQPGDLLLFDSHLMHRSTDNTSSSPRAAMVYHYARTATIDRTEETLGYSLNEWIDLEPSGTAS